MSMLQQQMDKELSVKDLLRYCFSKKVVSYAPDKMRLKM